MERSLTSKRIVRQAEHLTQSPNSSLRWLGRLVTGRSDEDVAIKTPPVRSVSPNQFSRVLPEELNLLTPPNQSNRIEEE